MKSNGTYSYDKYFNPLDSPMYQGSVMPKVVPWEFGIMQGIQTKKVKASTGQFKNLTGTLTANTINTGTINTSLFQNGTIANNVISGATISQPSVTGGTFINPTINTGTFNISLMTGTLNGALIGTPQVNHGTLNPDVYQTGGTAGATGSIIYVKTVSPETTFGTVNVTNCLILSIS